MGQISIQGPQAFPVTSPSGSLITGQNVGLGNLYLGSTVNTGANNYDQLLDPGGRFTWPGDKSLYVATDTGNVGTLSYTNNGATVTPGTAFSKTSNTLDLLFQHSTLLNNAVGDWGINSTKQIDISSYASLIFLISCDILPLSLQNGNYIELNILQTDVPNYLQTGFVNQCNAQWYIDATGVNLGPPMEIFNTMSMQVPVRHSSLYFNHIVHIGSTAQLVSGNHGIQIYGSSEFISSARYVNNTASLNGTIPINGTFYADHVGILDKTYPVASINGPAISQLINVNGTATGFVLGFITEGGSIQTIMSESIIAAAGQQTVNLQLPSRPLSLRLSQTTAGHEAILSLAQ